MNARLLIAAALTAASVAVAPVRADPLGDALLDEINYARANPRAYAEDLRATTRSGRRDDGFLYEDPAALDEAIAFLVRQPPLPPLQNDRRLAAVARGHVTSQGPRGLVGHGGTTSFGQRLHAQGVFAGMTAENISYGYEDPRDVVRQLIVDSGVPSRGHRANIFSRGYQAAGAACGRHQAYGAMCVIDFAGALVGR